MYWSTVTRLLTGDTVVDYLELRLAASRLRPTGPIKVSEALTRLRNALDHQTARAILDSAIRYNIAWAPAHNAAADSLLARGDTTRAELHRAISRGLIASMEADRVRPGSAGIRVVSVAEEYVYMRAKNLESTMQGLGTCGEYHCDHITAHDKTTNAPQELTFILTYWKSQ